MQVEAIAVGDFQANCYVVWGDAKQAIVIDPGAEATGILSFLEKEGLSVASYMLTHGHVDHISAIADLHDAKPAPIGLHAKDLDWAFELANQMPPFYDVPRRPANIERILDDEQDWTDSGLAYHVVATPGHTPGGVCFYFKENGALFTGDTLFAGSVGRTDLPGGDSRQLADSLKKLSGLPGETVVYAGHGPESTMEHERQHNFFMQSHGS